MKVRRRKKNEGIRHEGNSAGEEDELAEGDEEDEDKEDARVKGEAVEDDDEADEEMCGDGAGTTGMTGFICTEGAAVVLSSSYSSSSILKDKTDLLIFPDEEEEDAEAERALRKAGTLCGKKKPKEEKKRSDERRENRIKDDEHNIQSTPFGHHLPTRFDFQTLLIDGLWIEHANCISHKQSLNVVLFRCKDFI